MCPTIRENHAERLSFLTQTVRDQLSAGFRGRRILALPAAHMKLDRINLPDSYTEILDRDIATQGRAGPRARLRADPLAARSGSKRSSQGGDQPRAPGDVRRQANGQRSAQRRAPRTARSHRHERRAQGGRRLFFTCLSTRQRLAADDLLRRYRKHLDPRRTSPAGGRLLFAQSLPIGGNRLCTASATASGASLEEKRRLSRIRLQQNAAPEPEQIARRTEMEAACRACEQQLIAALNDCLAAFAKTGEAASVDRLICIGSEEPRDAAFCKRLAEGTASCRSGWRSFGANGTNQQHRRRD